MLIFYGIILLFTSSSIAFSDEQLVSKTGKLLVKSKRSIIDAIGNNQGNKYYGLEGIVPSYTSLVQYRSPYKSMSHAIDIQKQPYQIEAQDTVPHIGLYSPTYQAQVYDPRKYSSPYVSSLFSMPRDHILSGATSSAEQSGTSDPELGHQHQRPSSHSSRQSPSTDTNKNVPLSGEHFAYSTGTDRVKPQEAQLSYRGPEIQVPVYKTNHPVSRVAYANFHNPSRNFAFLQPASISEKKLSPAVERAEEFGSYARGFQSQPLVEYNGSRPANLVAKSNGAVAHSTFRGRVVPIQTSSSTPHFPQYKGASVVAYPIIGPLTQVPATYQALRAQPHLHFTPGNAVQSTAGRQSTLGQHASPERIRSDVEVINKEKPTPLPPSKDDDGNEDKEYDITNKYLGHGSSRNNDYPGHHGKSFSEEESESDFKPSKSFPFKQYDETFGKYSKSSSEEDEKPSSKYRSYGSKEEEDDDTPSSTSKYSSDGSEAHKYPYGKYEQKQTSEEEQDNGSNEGPSIQEKKYNYSSKSKSYQPKNKDFEREYQSSYRQGSIYDKY